ncbi:hypothetical protein GCM10027185_00910 [Spirosoma pulveris]
MTIVPGEGLGTIVVSIVVRLQFEKKIMSTSKSILCRIYDKLIVYNLKAKINDFYICNNN